eukprot:Platyproteum_vivax@DN6224_c0_g1_i1.p1
MSGAPVVICGGGILGCSVAYYLAEKQIKNIIVEQRTIACAASGNAGGFLARDWCDHHCVGPLARLGYKLHAELAESLLKLGKDVMYRPVQTVSVTATSKGRPTKESCVPKWLDKGVECVSELGNLDTTAQVHPRALCTALASVAQATGYTTVKIGRVENIIKEVIPDLPESDKTYCQRIPCENVYEVLKVQVDGEEVECSAVVLCMGPWNKTSVDWFPWLPDISSQRYHSITVQPAEPVTNHSCFCHLEVDGDWLDPELYPRSNNEVYICGEPDDCPLPPTSLECKHSAQSCKRLKEIAGMLSTPLSNAEVQIETGCWLPLSPDGLPIIGPVPGVRNAYITAGHACWGILTGPSSGLCVAELIKNGHCSSIDLEAFLPRRFLTRKLCCKQSRKWSESITEGEK